MGTLKQNKWKKKKEKKTHIDQKTEPNKNV